MCERLRSHHLYLNLQLKLYLRFKVVARVTKLARLDR